MITLPKRGCLSKWCPADITIHNGWTLGHVLGGDVLEVPQTVSPSL